MLAYYGTSITDHIAENFSAYSRGHVQNIHREGDYVVGDIHINDKLLAGEVLHKVKRQISCGYECVYEPLPDGRCRQTENQFKLLFSDGRGSVENLRIYSLKMWNASDELVLELVPCVDPSGVAGMYDTIGEEFYTSAEKSRYFTPTLPSEPDFCEFRRCTLPCNNPRIFA